MTVLSNIIVSFFEADVNLFFCDAIKFFSLLLYILFSSKHETDTFFFLLFCYEIIKYRFFYHLTK